MIRYLLLILLLCLPCWAAPVQKYVDFTLGTDDAGHGGAVGAGAWKTLSYANSQVGDISGVADGWQVNCSNGVDTTGVTIDPSVTITDAGSPLYIKGDATYTLRVTDASCFVIIGAGSGTFRVGNLTIETVSPTVSSRRAIYLTVVNSVVLSVDHCTIKGHASATHYQPLVQMNDTTSTLYAWNNLIYNVGTFNHASESGFYITAGTAVISNCTIVGGKYGVSVSSGTGTVTCTNVLVTGCATYDLYDAGGTTTAVHCIGETAWVTSGGFDTTADGNLESQDYSGLFTATYRLTTGNLAIDAGTDLTAGPPSFTDDIDGTARGATWDVGCDEYVSSGMNLFRRRAIQW